MTDAALPSPRDVLVFWFEEVGPEKWFVRDDDVDRAITSRFKALHEALAADVPSEWTETPIARLALVIVLDQFCRNIWRGSGHAFAADGVALLHAKALRDEPRVAEFSDEQKLFAFLPFEHSEAMEDQNEAVRLIGPLGNSYGDYAVKHRDVIERFGRFPHRNAALGRQSTPAEQEWLDAGGGF